mmetsp:Transcript_16103/g.27211  ORF Transcript_16103/g.27211 Transcript_16103/m.27211 type:complete len:98 (-) Transcript_16103:104-397(-)
MAEAWYLLAFCLVKLKKMRNANECLKNVEMLIEKQNITEEELVQGTRELRQTINQGLETQKNAEEAEEGEEKMDLGEEGYETYSEEDVSDEEMMEEE